MKKEQEIWKDILGYEELYQISNLGRVKSLERITNNQFGKKDLILPLRTIFNGRYVRVTLSKYGIVEELNVHVLVAIAFLDFTPGGWKFVVDHKDNDPLNNKASNLQIITHRFNRIKEIDKTITHSLYTGVTYHPDRKKYYASIKLKRTSIHLGTHVDNQEYLRDLYIIAHKYRNFYQNDPEEFRSFVHIMYLEEGYPQIDSYVTINLKHFTKGNIV